MVGDGDIGRAFLTLKKSFAVFPSPAGVSLFLAGNNLIIPGQREFGK